MSKYLALIKQEQEPGSHPELIRQHPVIAGSPTVGMISGENPLFAGSAHGHEALGQRLQQMGLRFEPTRGHYGAPERSYIVYGPSREQMFDLGRSFGQEAVIYGQGGRHEMLYTNGPKQGKFHPSLPNIDFFKEPPEDYYTEVPGQGYLRLYFNNDTMLDSPLRLGQQPAAPAPTPVAPKPVPAAQPQQMGGTADPHKQSVQNSPQPKTPSIDPSQLNRSEVDYLLRGIYQILKKGQIDVQSVAPIGYPARPHPNAYPWHDPHTSHHPHVLGPGGIMVSGSLNKAEGDTPHPHTSSYPKNPEQHATNDQASKVGISTYAKYAMPYGKVNPGTKSDLTHYPYHGKLPEIERMVKDHGYQTYYAGGKYGRPDLANRNYNTKHLMVYDPTPESGGDFGDEEYTKGWRQIHELAHALTYPELNQTYGEGKRIGALGKHRNLREATRAVHWEWLAAHKQRELSKLIGVHVPDEVFHRELNTVMHDAVHRAITGRFTEPSGEGYVPHSHKVPLETALGMVHEHARNLGLRDPNETLKKSGRSPDVADDKLMSPQEFTAELAKGVKERLAPVAKVLEKIHELELAKNAVEGYAAPTASVNGSSSGPMAMAERSRKVKKAEDYIDVKNDADPKKRVVTHGTNAGCLPDDKPSKVIPGGSGGQTQKSETQPKCTCTNGFTCRHCLDNSPSPRGHIGEGKANERQFYADHPAAKARLDAIGTKKAEPPMAKPPGKPPTPAAPPTSKPMAKAIPGQMGIQDQQAMVQAHTPKFSAAAPAKPTFTGAPVPQQGIQAQQADAQATHGNAFGAKPPAPAIRQAGTPAAGAIQKPAGPKPGIFGRLASSLAKPTPTTPAAPAAPMAAPAAQTSPKLPGAK